MSRIFYVLSVFAAMFFAAVVVSCDKDAEKLLETVKNEIGELKVEYDDQNRVAKIVWLDKSDDAFKKTTFNYDDDLIKLKNEKISYDEYIMTDKYTVLEDRTILNDFVKNNHKKIVIEH